MPVDKAAPSLQSRVYLESKDSIMSLLLGLPSVSQCLGDCLSKSPWDKLTNDGS